MSEGHGWRHCRVSFFTAFGLLSVVCVCFFPPAYSGGLLELNNCSASTVLFVLSHNYHFWLHFTSQPHRPFPIEKLSVVRLPLIGASSPAALPSCPHCRPAPLSSLLKPVLHVHVHVGPFGTAVTAPPPPKNGLISPRALLY